MSQLTDRERMRSEAGLDKPAVQAIPPREDGTPATVPTISDRERMRMDAGVELIPRVEPSGDSPVQEAAEDEPRSLANRAARRGGADVIATPGALAGLATVARAGVERFLLGTVDTFGEGMLNAEGRELWSRMFDETATDQDKMRAGAEFNELGTDAFRWGARKAMEWEKWGAGITDAQYNEDGTIPLDEEIGGLALTSILTAPLLPVRAATAAAKAGTVAAKRTAMQTVSRTALKTAELMTPITVVPRNASAGAITATAAANFGVGVGITEVLRTAMEEETILDNLSGKTDDNATPDQDGEGWGMTGAIGAAAGATALATAVMRPGRASKVLEKLVDSGLGPQGITPSVAKKASTIGNLRSTTAREAAADVANEVLDDKAIIRSTLERTGVDSERVADLDNLARSTAAQTTDIQYRRATREGILDPAGEVRTIPWDVIERSYKSLNQTQQQTFNNAYSALDELGRRNRGIEPSYDKDVTNDLLRQRVQLGRNEPAVNKLMQSYQKYHDDWITARYNAGIIDDAQRAREAGSGAYMHNVEAELFDSIWERVRDRLTNSSAERRIGLPPSEKQADVGGMVAKLSPMEAGRRYTLQQIQNTAQNRVRREVLSTLQGRHQQRSQNSIVRKLRKGEKATGNTQTITVRNFGKDETYAVGDQRLYNALMYRPRTSVPMFNATRKVFQKFTTGNFNPLFAGVSALYDHSAGLMGVRTSQSVGGVLDQGLKNGFAAVGVPKGVADSIRAGLRPGTAIVDLPLNVVEGVSKGLYGRMKQMRTERLIQRAAESGLQVDEDAARIAIDEYSDSMYALAERAGYSPGAFSAVDEGSENVIKEMQGFVGNTVPVRAYVNLLESIRDSARMAHFSRNVSQAQIESGTSQLTGKELRRVAASTRDLGADITKQSGIQTVNKALSTVPYGNVIMQSTAHLVHQMMTNPAAWSTMLAISGMRLLQMQSMSPEAREYWETQIPAYKRTDEFWMEVPREDGEAFDPAIHMKSFPIGPEVGFITSLGWRLFEGAGQQEGLLPPAKRGPQYQSSWEQTMAAVSDLVGFSTPPLANIVANALGGGDLNFANIATDRPIMREPRELAAQDDQRGYGQSGGIINDRIAGTMNAAMGTVGRMMSDTLETLIDHPMGTASSEAWRDAMDVAVFQGVERQVVGQLFSNATVVNPRSTAINDKVYTLNREMTRAADMSRALVPDTSRPNDADLFAGKSFQLMKERLETPELAEQAHLLHRYMLSSRHAHDMNIVGQLKERLHLKRGNVDAPVEEKNQELNKLNSEIQERMTRVMSNYAEFEQNMKKRYGPEWSMTTFLRNANRDLYD